jgi:hypothetical protein
MTSLFRIKALVALSALACLLAGCAGGATGPSASSPPPRPVTTPADALASVIGTEPRLTGITPFDTGLIGQSSWYSVEPASGVGAFIVSIHVGWGDCPAGCINEHSWTYAVAPDGRVTLESESGPAVPADAWPSPGGAGRTGIAGAALAGPVCPVERDPPDPACAARPVVGATVVIRDGGGSEVARTVTADDGSFFVETPAGEYVVEPQPANGLMGTAASQNVTVVDGAVVVIQLDYDTGIR